MFDIESSAKEYGPIQGIKIEVCYGCSSVVNGDDDLFEHFATSRSCKNTYDGGTGFETTVKKFWEDGDTNDALRLKILTKIDEDLYEAADKSGICKLKVHSENTNKDIIDVGKTFDFMKPRCFNLKEKIILIGKTCHVVMTPNIKIGLKKFNEDLNVPEKV